MIQRKSIFDKPAPGRKLAEPKRGKAVNVTTMLYQDQIDYLDDVIYHLRKKKRVKLNRAEILRGILDAVMQSGTDLQTCLSEQEIKTKLLQKMTG